MRRLLLLYLSPITAFSFLVGCYPEAETASDSRNATEREATKTQDVALQGDVFVFRAKYYRTKGPCIQIGDALAMPAVDAFEVVEVLQGDLQAKGIGVRPLSSSGPGYPKELTEGKVYTLRLTPSGRSKEQLRENEKEGYRFIWVDQGEIEEQKTGKQ